MPNKSMLYFYYEPYSTIAEEAIADGKVSEWLTTRLEKFRRWTQEGERYLPIFFATDNVFGHLIMAVANGLIARDEFELIRNGQSFVMDEHGSFTHKETGQPLELFTTDYRPSAIYLDAHIALTMGKLGKE